MAQSAINYKDKIRFVSDVLLGKVLICIFDVVDSKKYEDLTHYGWLTEAIHEWWTFFEDFPPGLKDIYLDKWLDTQDRKAVFLEVLNEVVKKDDTDISKEVMKFIEILQE